jgi:DNA-binding protein HU-beta
MPRTSKKVAVVRKLKRQTAAQKKMIKELRAKAKTKRMISRGLLLPAAGMTTTTKTRKRRTPSVKAATIAVKVGGRKKATISVLPSCSTAGRTLKKKGTGRKPVSRAASKAGRTLSTPPCSTRGRKVSTTKRKTTTAKRKTTTRKSTGGGLVSKVLKTIFGGGKKSTASAIKLPKVGVKKAAPKKSTAKTTAKRVVRKSSTSKLARIKRIVC